ncbi:hypothetical protein Droror1_Dr00020116 [Drosera rotundifolia]
MADNKYEKCMKYPFIYFDDMNMIFGKTQANESGAEDADDAEDNIRNELPDIDTNMDDVSMDNIRMDDDVSRRPSHEFLLWISMAQSKWAAHGEDKIIGPCCFVIGPVGVKEFGGEESKGFGPLLLGWSDSNQGKERRRRAGPAMGKCRKGFWAFV